MHIKHKQKLCIILITLFGIGLSLGFVLYALRKNVDLYYTPLQVFQQHVPTNKEFRLGGLVKTGSVIESDSKNSLSVHFVVTDFHKKLEIYYQGILPVLFREGQGIVAEGHLNKQGVFIASQVLAKHDER